MTRPLTPRQRELLERLTTGASVRQVARDMHIAVDTAYNLRADAFDRLNVLSLPEAWSALGWLVVRSA